MNLVIKCVAAVIIMIGVHFVSKTKNFYIAGLVLGFPGLSIIAYYFMYREQGVLKVRMTTYFAMLAVIPFFSFLVALNFALKKNNIFYSILISSVVWIVLSLIVIFIWNKKNLF